MIHASKRELRNAFQVHCNKYEDAQLPKTMSDYLLLFYAVECGLKYLILDDNKKDTTEDFASIIHNGRSLSEMLGGKGGHDLNQLLTVIRHQVKILPLTVERKKEAIRVAVCDFNQIWRYGIRCETHVQSDRVAKLYEIVKYIRKQIAVR